MIIDAGAAEAGLARIKGFPQLRADRFLASFSRDRLTGEAYRYWLERMENSANEARRRELKALPAENRQQIQRWLSPHAAPEAVLEHCAHLSIREELVTPEGRTRLLKRIHVPDDYADANRILGFYPLLKIPFLQGVSELHRHLRDDFAKTAAHPPSNRLVRYAPRAGLRLTRIQAADILRRSAQNPLRMPIPETSDLDALFETFAPVWEVETADDDDRIGEMRRDDHGKALVDVARPAVYRLASHTRYGNRTLLQLNYMIWFPARAPAGPIDIYAGALDGIIWRVTLSPEGAPIAYDSIHPCGCYYQIFPGPGYRVIQPEDGGEPVLSPFPLRPAPSGRHQIIRLASRTHFIQHIYAAALPGDVKPYEWRHYEELLSLPRKDASGRGSLFNAAGFIEGSERTERFLYWPMGIDNAGAMRQWGTHAIAFVGRRHFDDPGLLESLLRPLNRSMLQQALLR